MIALRCGKAAINQEEVNMAPETTIHDVATVDQEVSYLGNGRQVIKYTFRDKTGEPLHAVTMFAADNPANGHKVTEHRTIQG
jgi:type IV secretory pathway VirB6-like protein